MFGNRKLWLFCFAAALLVIAGSLVGWPSVAPLFDRETLIQFFSRLLIALCSKDSIKRWPIPGWE